MERSVFCQQEVRIMKWIFFDVGSTLVDETEAYNHRAREMLAGTDVTFAEFDAKRTEFAKQGLDGNSEAVQYFGLRKTPWHSEDEVPYPDAADTLRYLRERGYQLGVIANQPFGTAQRLEAWGLGSWFDVVAASAELGVTKPDRAIFEKALSKAGCRPEDAVMVGDRLDNDIIPAKAVGMATVWIRNGLSAYQTSDIPDSILDTLSEMKNLF